MPPLDPAVVRERAARLREAGAAMLAAELGRRVGGEGNVLIERPGRGRADCYAAVRVDAAAEVGSLRRMRFTGATPTELIGVPV